MGLQLGQSFLRERPHRFRLDAGHGLLEQRDRLAMRIDAHRLYELPVELRAGELAQSLEHDLLLRGDHAGQHHAMVACQNGQPSIRRGVVTGQLLAEGPDLLVVAAAGGEFPSGRFIQSAFRGAHQEAGVGRTQA